MTQLSDYDVSRRSEATVKTSQRITPANAPEVRNIRLSVNLPSTNFREGQSIGVVVPGRQAFGNEGHFRLYTIANSPVATDSGGTDLELCVRRCFYLDEVSGEEYPGVASNYLCDARPGDRITLTGPYGSAFAMPKDPSANLLMIGTGTGIAPFRAFIQNVYEKQPHWQGQIRLYYGARSGVEKLYQNDEANDLADYYDRKTFKAFEGLSRRPWSQGDENGLHAVLEQNAEEIWQLIEDPKTYLYLAGLPKTLAEFNKIMAETAGSQARLRLTREEMLEQGRWAELLYG